MSDRCFLSALLPLLNLPTFQEGLHNGMEAFEEGMFASDLEKAWTEDDIIEFVNDELSESVYRRTQLIGCALDSSMPPYLTHLGFALSYLALVLSTKANQEQKSEGQDATG